MKNILVNTILFSLFFVFSSYGSSPSLSFDHLPCGTYEMRGKLILKSESDQDDYYLYIYPAKNKFYFKKSRKIKVRYSKSQKNILKTHQDLPVTIHAKYEINSNKENYIELDKVIGPTSSINIYKKDLVIREIATRPCKKSI
tara:strand:+ start:1362 stop:1787 length:426 start_codon:yes stop_codon:yes gene_type:complete